MQSEDYTRWYISTPCLNCFIGTQNISHGVDNMVDQIIVNSNTNNGHSSDKFMPFRPKKFVIRPNNYKKDAVIIDETNPGNQNDKVICSSGYKNVNKRWNSKNMSRTYYSAKHKKFRNIDKDDGYDVILKNLPLLYPNNSDGESPPQNNEKVLKNKQESFKKVRDRKYLCEHDCINCEPQDKKLNKMFLTPRCQRPVDLNNFISDDCLKDLHKSD